MKPLFSAEGLARLDEIIQKGMLCAFDFDGTLSPIVSRPQDAALPPEVREKLLVLATLTPVAILTGRAIEDIHTRLGFTPDYLVGNHGLEGVPGWEAQRDSYAACCRQWGEHIRSRLSEWEYNDPGFEIEDKHYSLTVHYRHAADPAESEKRLSPFLKAALPDALVVDGKFMFSIVPPDAPNKGKALDALMTLSRAPSVLYVGDDITDEDVFRLPRNDLLSIHVEDSNSSAAPWYIESHDAIGRLLDTLIDRLQSL